jgi:CheY-like chemotaxis protein
MEAIGQLAAGVAHDFNNLLTIIQGYTSLQLAKSNLETDIANAFAQIKMASERAASLTRQLLAFSRQQLVQRKPLELGTALSRMKTMLSRALGETIQLECRLAPARLWINADESGLDQVIMNLAVNARDAMPDGGKLSLSTDLATIAMTETGAHPSGREGEFVVLTVTDTGCGMEQRTLDRIFEPFFTTKPIGRGTGLGLSTVYGIVRQHEGWIEVQSRPGQGTTFRVFLPAGQQPPEPEPPPAAPISQHHQPTDPGQTILLVEDEPTVRRFVAAVLAKEGYQVVQAASGAEALVTWNGIAHQVRLLLTDMVMPEGISGTTLAGQLLRRNPDLKVIYTSGYSPDLAANGHLLKEGVDFLTKPFTRDHLLATVRNALNSTTACRGLVPSDPSCT